MPAHFKRGIQEKSRQKNLNSVSSVYSVVMKTFMRLPWVDRAECWKRGRERV